MESDDYGAVASIIAAAIASSSSAATSAYATRESSKNAEKAREAQAKLATPNPADTAASGLMRSSISGSSTPAFSSSLSGKDITGPSFGVGSAVANPIGGSQSPGLGGQADEFANILRQFSGGGGGLGGLGGGLS